MILEWICITVYSASLLMILFYSFSQLNLLVNYLKAQNKNKQASIPVDQTDELPFVTIQLPVFNELYVMERLLDNMAFLEYPKSKLEIQVLDDSTDESVEITSVKVKKLQDLGFDVSHIQREIRTSYKAGALKEGLKIAKGDFIAIFDADFLPESDWLLKTVGHFKDPKVGVVQTRWSHLNRDYSILTQVQAFALDAHFTLEQVGRNSKGHFINFNGTAGIWRKQTIFDAGNWQGDTLTEDLDLSYRAQLKNWKFVYLEDVTTPAELPIVISAARSQQFRWNKGGAENFQKMFRKVLSSKNLSLKTKFHGILHLLNSTMFLNVLIVAVLSIPMLYIKNEYEHLKVYFIVMSFFVISTIIFFICYWFMYRNTYGGGFKSFVTYIGMFFTFFSIAMGFSLHNSIAVIEGHLGKSSEFVRTPKFNLAVMGNNWKTNKYLRKKLSPNVIIEGILMLYFIFGLYSAFIVGDQGGDFGLFPFHLMLVIGFGFVFFSSLTDKQ
ncbi:Glycosyltransferase, catalytic subunit of cellulose synthase and poly-beta-1,6-N-acetylglucosamine synthase [Nonlabens sp. Hel1_33_55]|uniref:cellulose synthase family protein n=1 Tax=Nonlabens sp. Hel1_33_55 TaxID=1336802 RepID=UPI000875E175|nr:cellulose synthase family protein [Nonlabens sp. Hel1_33_55]SCY43892.1 Glycosyltransferase, catalytic subunit of cellulose synthase and poly-beta-1,6-N-acetylglucosamine synthase [Nonlabens sp. Hel1_33_55]